MGSFSLLESLLWELQNTTYIEGFVRKTRSEEHIVCDLFGYTGPAAKQQMRPWYVPSISSNREFKQITMTGATTAAVTEKIWGDYVSVVCQTLAKWNTKMSQTWAKEFKIYLK